jgi:hypothetical protein
LGGTLQVPSSIVSDRAPVFTGNIWRDLFGLAGLKLHMSTAFQPQTDGQSEVMNKVIAMYLSCVTGDRPRSWVDWLSWAEYYYNTSFHTALCATPFEVVYGRPPPSILPYMVRNPISVIIPLIHQQHKQLLRKEIIACMGKKMGGVPLAHL